MAEENGRSKASKASAPIHAYQAKVREWKRGGMQGPRPEGLAEAVAKMTKAAGAK